MCLLFASSLLVPVPAGCASRVLGVPDVRQATVYTCSASALQAVLAYSGDEVPEAELATSLGATPQDGAPPEAIVRVARARGLVVEQREGVRLAEVRAHVRAGHPVMLAIQAWADPPPASWQMDWDDGHYVVVIGVERGRVIFEDPSLLGSHGWLRPDELEARWHDMDAARKNDHLAIFFGDARTRPPRPTASAQHID